MTSCAAECRHMEISPQLLFLFSVLVKLCISKAGVSCFFEGGVDSISNQEDMSLVSFP